MKRVLSDIFAKEGKNFSFQPNVKERISKKWIDWFSGMLKSLTSKLIRKYEQ
jgi:hypothetical protein